MSEYVIIATAFTDASHLVEALVDLGFPRDTIEVHKRPVTLYGYRGDARAELAEIVVRQKHVGRGSNDLGFARQPDGTFRAIISRVRSADSGHARPLRPGVPRTPGAGLRALHDPAPLPRPRLPGPGRAALGRDDPGRRPALRPTMPKLVFTIDTAGKAALNVEGAPGPACHTFTREAEELLGLATHRERTREYYQQAPIAAPQQTQST
jgi:hypothetical protein